MKSKKEVSAWYAAATFYLTAGFVMPLIFSLIYSLIVSPLVGEGTIDSILAIVFVLFGIWIGIMYSARYIRKVYIIRDGKKIINLATIYLVVLLLLWWVIVLQIPFFLIGYAIRVAIFYFLSRVYVKENLGDAPMSQAGAQS